MKICLTCRKSYKSQDWTCPHCGKSTEGKEGFYSFINDNRKALESFDALSFPKLFRLEKDHFWFQHRSRLILNTIERFFPNISEVNEIGCGTGLILSEIDKRFPGLHLSGSDLFLEGLNFAQERVKKGAFYQMDACNMPFKEEFDLILALDIIEHIDEDTKALENMYRSIKPGGGIILTVPQHRWLWSVQDEKSFHKRRYSRHELVDKVHACGFQVIHTTSFVSLLLPLMVLSRLLGQFITHKQQAYDLARELKISPVINRILRMICHAEEFMINNKISLPAGGSLLCVGIK
jgi:SAM-dependent methyltransferase